jgi:hypothetical protein
VVSGRGLEGCLKGWSVLVWVAVILTARDCQNPLIFQ